MICTNLVYRNKSHKIMIKLDENKKDHFGNNNI